MKEFTHHNPRVRKTAERESQSHHCREYGLACNFLNFRTHSKPRSDSNKSMGSININLDCVRRALSEINTYKWAEVFNIRRVNWLQDCNIPHRSKKPAKAPVHWLRPSSRTTWYAVGRRRAPLIAGTSRSATTGTLAGYGLPMLSNLKSPRKEKD